eukprot:3943700-Prymnesium_polylepis.1
MHGIEGAEAQIMRRLRELDAAGQIGDQQRRDQQELSSSQQSFCRQRSTTATAPVATAAAVARNGCEGLSDRRTALFVNAAKMPQALPLPPPVPMEVEGQQQPVEQSASSDEDKPQSRG